MLLTGKRIAVVEDDVTNMAIISTLLRQNGATVIQDPWNTGTVERLRQLLPIDLILLDLMLRHGISGYDIFDKLRATPEFENVPVVVVSASDPALEMNRAQQKGINGYIEKPVSYRDFAQQIEAVLDGNEVWG
jgi:two-component system, cell cycle response regulator DivK